MKSLSRLMAVTRKEVRQMRRDKLTFAMILAIPLMQILLFGFAINTDVRNLTTAVADEANTHLSREFTARLQQTQVTNITTYVNTVADLDALMRAGEISVGVHIPVDFDRRVIDPERAAVHLLVDGSDINLGQDVGGIDMNKIQLDQLNKGIEIKFNKGVINPLNRKIVKLY